MDDSLSAAIIVESIMYYSSFVIFASIIMIDLFELDQTPFPIIELLHCAGNVLLKVVSLQRNSCHQKSGLNTKFLHTSEYILSHRISNFKLLLSQLWI